MGDRGRHGGHRRGHEGNSGVKGRVRARPNAPEGMTDRQTHTHTHDPYIV